MKFYVTFKDQKTVYAKGHEFDSDTVAVLDCISFNQAKAKASRLFGNNFNKVKEKLNREVFYSKGCIKI